MQTVWRSHYTKYLSRLIAASENPGLGRSKTLWEMFLVYMSLESIGKMCCAIDYGSLSASLSRLKTYFYSGENVSLAGGV